MSKIKKHDDAYYEKIVKYENNGETPTHLVIGLILFGSSMASFLYSLPGIIHENLWMFGIAFFITSMFFFITNYFMTHDRIVKFEKIK